MFIVDRDITGLLDISVFFLFLFATDFLEKLVSKVTYYKVAVNGFPSYNYGTSLAIWDHTVLPATRHKITHPALTPTSKLVFDLPTLEGWKAE